MLGMYERVMARDDHHNVPMQYPYYPSFPGSQPTRSATATSSEQTPYENSLYSLYYRSQSEDISRRHFYQQAAAAQSSLIQPPASSHMPPAINNGYYGYPSAMNMPSVSSDPRGLSGMSQPCQQPSATATAPAELPDLPHQQQQPAHVDMSSPTSTNCSAPTTGLKPSPASPSDPASGSSGDSSVDNTSWRVPPKKRPHAIPEEQKDDTYWVKRKKNNESAKKSREQRRTKEQRMMYHMTILEAENVQLQTESAMLRTEIERLKSMMA